MSWTVSSVLLTLFYLSTVGSRWHWHFLIDKAETLGNYTVCWRSQRCLGLYDSKVRVFSTVLPLQVNNLHSLSNQSHLRGLNKIQIQRPTLSDLFRRSERGSSQWSFWTVCLMNDEMYGFFTFDHLWNWNHFTISGESSCSWQPFFFLNGAKNNGAFRLNKIQYFSKVKL